MDIIEEALDEALSIMQRKKRAQIARQNKKKLERGRFIAKSKMANTKALQKRAMKAARQLLRRKLAGKRGEEYETLGPAEKIEIDKKLDGKVKAIRKLASRLLPRIQKAEAQRLASFTKGKQLKNMNEEINNKFGSKFKGKKASRVANQIKMYNKFSEERILESSAYKNLIKKASKSNIDIEILGEVFDRGLDSWNENKNVSREQYAFARVNSYINQGKSYFNEDADLHEGNNPAHKELSDLKKHLGFVHVGLKHYHDEQTAALEPKDTHKFQNQKQKIHHIHNSLKKAGYKKIGGDRSGPTGHVSHWSSNEHNEAVVHVPHEENPKKYGVTAVHYTNYKHDHGHKPDVHANLSDAGHEDGHKIYNRELGHHAIKENLERRINNRHDGIGRAEYSMKEELTEQFKVGDKVHIGLSTKGGAGYVGTVYGKKHHNNEPHLEISFGHRGERTAIGPERYATKINEDLDESNNTPYVKKIKGLSGQDTWKAGNKHGKVKFFNNPESANKHADIKKVNEEILDELSKNTLKSYSKKAAQDIENLTYAAGRTPDSERKMQRLKKSSNRIKGISKAVDKISEAYNINDFEPKHVQGLHNFKHYEHPDGTWIQKMHGKSYHVVVGGKGRKHTTLHSPDELKKHLSTLSEELGPENEIGTDALTRKYRKGTPGQENAETHENCGTADCCGNCTNEEILNISTASADKKMVKVSGPEGKSHWKKVRRKQDLVKDKKEDPGV